MDKIKPTSIKLPEDLYTKLKTEADEQERSVSSEIIYICKQYFKNKE